MEEHLERIMCGRHFRRVIFKQMNDICGRYKLKKIEIDVLLYLADCKNQNTGCDIQKYLEINKGYLSQILDNLSKNGYVVSSPDKNDRRYIHYNLTDSSLEIIEKVELSHAKINDKIFSGLSESEIETLKNISAKIFSNMQDILENGI